MCLSDQHFAWWAINHLTCFSGLAASLRVDVAAHEAVAMHVDSVGPERRRFWTLIGDTLVVFRTAEVVVRRIAIEV